MQKIVLHRSHKAQNSSYLNGILEVFFTSNDLVEAVPRQVGLK